MLHPRLTSLAVVAGLAAAAGCYSGPSRPWFHKQRDLPASPSGCADCAAGAGVSEGPILGDPNVVVPPGNGVAPDAGLPPGAIPVPGNGGGLVPQPGGVPPRLVPTPQAQPEPFRP